MTHEQGDIIQQSPDAFHHLVTYAVSQPARVHCSDQDSLLLIR